ncbi:MAG: hypothetical protein ACOY4T_11765 [Pseudomonadota bacterium]
MAQQIINIGVTANDGTGDGLRAGAGKINANFTELYAKSNQITVTQPVDLDWMETRILALDASVVLKGVWSAAAGTFPGGGTAQAGESWIVSVAGTVGGVDFAVNDRIIAILDNASAVTFAANWFKADYSDVYQTPAQVVSAYESLTPLPNQAELDNGTGTSVRRWTVAWLKQAVGTFVNMLGTTLAAKATPVAADRVLIYDSAASYGSRVAPMSAFTFEAFTVAVSDEATALTAGTAKITFRMPFAMVLTAVRASVKTAPTGATIIVDVNEANVSIFSTALSIDVSQKTSVTAAVPAVISDANLADDAEITIDIDQVGSTVAGAGLKVTFIGYRP